jgi:glycine cleavage system T protein (aminomethyltransferase)
MPTELPTEPPRHSPLDHEHRSLGARMVDFGGWEMPIQYTGVLEEHRACRDDAVVFDVSHLGSVRVEGPGALDALQWAFTNDLGRIGPGRAQYTHLLDPFDAHVVDDIIVWWVAPDAFLVMPNASNTDQLLGALGEAVGEHAAGPCVVEDVTATRAVLAVQGPKARVLLGSLLPEAAAVARFATAPVTFDSSVPVALAGGPNSRRPDARLLQRGFAAGTGYTGEDGVELHVPLDVAARVWRSLLDTGLVPAGLGARDTLRLEAGLPLHGHELGPGISPLQAGLAWVVRFDKGDFRGRDPLVAERDRGIGRRLRGLIADGRQVPRADCSVSIDGTARGVVTSGNFSPVLGRGIALAFLPPDVTDGTRVTIDVRGRSVPATVVPTPFVHRPTAPHVTGNA